MSSGSATSLASEIRGIRTKTTMILLALGCMWGRRQQRHRGRNREATLMGTLECLVHQDQRHEVPAQDSNLKVGPQVPSKWPSRPAGISWASPGPLW